MTLSILYVALISLAVCALGVAAGFFLARSRIRGNHSGQTAAYLEQLDAVSAERDALAAREHELQSDVDGLRADSTSVREQLDKSRHALTTAKSKMEKTNQQAIALAKNLQALRAERESTKSRVNSLQGMLVAVHQKTQSLQTEFQKAQTIYKRELAKSVDRRKQLETQLSAARAEQVAFKNRISKSIEEHGSAEGMVESAQLRLGQIDVLERTVEKLEAEKTDFEAKAKQLRKDNTELKQELSKIDELKIHNQQLVLAVEALEKSRMAHEEEAEQHRDRAEESEQLSDTLRMKLEDLEKGFAEMEQEQNQAIRHVRDVSVVGKPAANEESGAPVHLTG